MSETQIFYVKQLGVQIFIINYTTFKTKQNIVGTSVAQLKETTIDGSAYSPSEQFL